MDSWLEARERDLEGAVAVATSEKEAKRRLKEHEVTACFSEQITLSVKHKPKTW